MLTADQIQIERSEGNIVIEPWDERCLGPNSYDIHLGDELLIYTSIILDTRSQNKTELLKIPPEGIVLEPDRLYLGKTVEYTESHNLVPMCEGRSSVGRLGICIHETAGFGDIGFKGRWTLEISVKQLTRVYAGDKIGQLYWHRPDGRILKTYSGKYQDSQTVKASEMWRDYEKAR